MGGGPLTLAQPGLEVAAQGAAPVLKVQKNIVVDEFAHREAWSAEIARDGSGGSSVPIDLDPVPPGRMMIAWRAKIQNEFPAADLVRHQLVGGACGALVGVIDHDDRIGREVRQRAT